MQWMGEKLKYLEQILVNWKYEEYVEVICSEMGKIGYWLFGAVNGMDRRPM